MVSAYSKQESPEMTKPNFTSTVLQQDSHNLSKEDEEILMWSCASLFGGTRVRYPIEIYIYNTFRWRRYGTRKLIIVVKCT